MESPSSIRYTFLLAFTYQEKVPLSLRNSKTDSNLPALDHMFIYL